jgi:hypothetical protein
VHPGSVEQHEAKDLDLDGSIIEEWVGERGDPKAIGSQHRRAMVGGQISI